MQRRYLKTAVSVTEFIEICRRADSEGLTLAAYLRTALARDEDRISVLQTLDQFRLELEHNRITAQPDHSGVSQAAINEMLELLRLLANRADPQAAARISNAWKGK